MLSVAPDCVPGTGLSASHTQFQLNLTRVLRGWDTLYPYSITEESKTQKRDITCPGPHNWEVVELGFKSGLSDTAEFIVPTTHNPIL